jgi:ATPase subunit of ABC transporter with duplicated ATPase domains
VAVEVTPGVPLLRGVTFDLRGATRVALTGPNGIGKSTLLRVLMGTHPACSGTVYRGVTRERFAWLDQHALLLEDSPTVLAAYQQRHPTQDATTMRGVLAAYQFRADAAHLPIASLSGGERVRAALACVLGAPGGVDGPCCLLLDEPTNHLDLESLEVLEGALRAWDGALVVVSHDVAFLEAIGVDDMLPMERWRAT